MKRLLAELKHRQIYKFGVIYLAVAWLLIQVVVNIETPLSLPGWMDTLVITLLAVGFPIALLFAWLNDRPTNTPAASQMFATPGAGGMHATGSNAAAPTAAGAAKPRGEIKFCTTPGGHRLAYSRFGKGPPLLRTGNWVSHLDAEWDSPLHAPMLRDFSREFDLVIYDGRGTGLADRDVTEFSLDTMVEDMEVVADANRLERFGILAYSQSCAVAIAYAVRHPERVSRMVLYGGFAHNFRTAEEVNAIAALFAQSWGKANPATRQIFTASLFPESSKEEFDAFNELQREAIAPETASRLFRACHAIDVRELAKQVSVPTLVMHSRNEPGVPVECGREIASLIPGARFVPLDSCNHLVLEREPAYRQFIDETVAFVRGGN